MSARKLELRNVDATLTKKKDFDAKLNNDIYAMCYMQKNQRSSMYPWWFVHDTLKNTDMIFKKLWTFRCKYSRKLMFFPAIEAMVDLRRTFKISRSEICADIARLHRFSWVFCIFSHLTSHFAGSAGNVTIKLEKLRDENKTCVFQ